MLFGRLSVQALLSPLTLPIPSSARFSSATYFFFAQTPQTRKETLHTGYHAAKWFSRHALLRPCSDPGGGDFHT